MIRSKIANLVMVKINGRTSMRKKAEHVCVRRSLETLEKRVLMTIFGEGTTFSASFSYPGTSFAGGNIYSYEPPVLSAPLYSAQNGADPKPIIGASTKSIADPYSVAKGSFSIAENATISRVLNGVQNGQVHLAGSIDYSGAPGVKGIDGSYAVGWTMNFTVTTERYFYIKYNYVNNGSNQDFNGGSYGIYFAQHGPNNVLDSSGIISNGGAGTLTIPLIQGDFFSISSSVSTRIISINSGHIDSSSIFTYQIGSVTPPPVLPKVVLESVTKTDANDVGLAYTISQAAVVQPLVFTIYQSDQPSFDNSSQLLGEKSLPISDMTDLSQGNHNINLLLNTNTPISVDPTRPYIVVVAKVTPESVDSVNTISTANIPPYTPDEIRAAYDLLPVEQLPTNWSGSGQTIAIVIAYNDPSIYQDANAFSSQFQLPLFGTTGGPSLTIYNSSGIKASLNGVTVSPGSNQPPVTLPPADPKGIWESEEAMDVEWAHAIAPNANIDIVDVLDNSTIIDTARLNAARVAGSLPGVSVVSMSFGTIGAFEAPSETSYDHDFTAAGVTYVASSGDLGSNQFVYPAASPNVLAVGGTTLTLASQGDPTNYSSYQDYGWSGSGGGFSRYESEPQYQKGFGVQSNGKRAVPDVSFDADSNTGVYIFNSYSTPSSPWSIGDGTSLGAPAWAGLLAIVNQDRMIAGKLPLTGATQTLPALYSAPSDNFIDVQSGSNGSFNATSGYDEVTGRGSPIAGNLIPYLTAWQPVLLSANLTLAGTFGVTINQYITASGGSGSTVLTITPTWTIFPQGVLITASNNKIAFTGKPILRGIYTFNVTATDPFGATKTRSYKLIIT